MKEQMSLGDLITGTTEGTRNMGQLVLKKVKAWIPHYNLFL